MSRRQTQFVGWYWGLAAGVLAALLSCVRPPQSPTRPGKGTLSRQYADAQVAEQERPSPEALGVMLDLLDQGVEADRQGDAQGFEAVAAALDAIYGRRTAGLDWISGPNALAFRVKEGPGLVRRRLESAYGRARGDSWTRPLLAIAGMTMAMFDGEEEESRRWRARTGCVRSAVVLGPLDWAGLMGMEEPLTVEKPGAALAASYPGTMPFGGESHPHMTEADGCTIETDLSSAAPGLRAIVVDVDSTAPRRLWLGLTSGDASILSVGGKTVLRRPFEGGKTALTRVGVADVPAGRARIVVKMAARSEDRGISLWVTDGDGSAVATRAPATGDVAPAVVSFAKAIEPRTPDRSAADIMLVASALLSLGDGRGAERLLEASSRDAQAPALVLLGYARALSVGSVLPEVRRVERQREAFERALGGMPKSWEAAVGVSVLAGQRRGNNEGRIETAAELGRLRGRGVLSHPILDVFESACAANSQLLDRAEAAFLRASVALSGAPLLERLELMVHRRSAQEYAQRACSVGMGRDSKVCFEARVLGGDSAGALAELDRLRKLRGSPSALREEELNQHIARRDAARTLALYDSLPQGRKVGAALGLLLAERPAEARERLARDMVELTDGPEGVLALRQASGDRRDEKYDGLAEKMVAVDRQHPAMPEAATLVLEHQETYTLGRRGELVYTLFDLRRVSGTQDVELGVEVSGATVEGPEAHHVLRRRIHKRDGRVLEPDQAAHASQDHSDLSQLEQGDYVEQLISGVATPGSSRQVVVDTPDLLPPRTSMGHARIEVRYPKNLALSRWAHPMLAVSAEREEGEQRVWVLGLREQGPRRLERGIPKMERGVSVSFGTQSWRSIARGVREATQAMVLGDPVVDAFAESAAGAEKHGVRLLERVVAAVGKKIRSPSATGLTDVAAGFASGPQETTARTILELGQGSRTWLAWQSLFHLGISCELVVAESEPFSSNPAFPAHIGRFDHPLLVAYLKEGGMSQDVWLDLDVAGPPLPPGKVSPELRGRAAMRLTGEIIHVPALAETGPDEVDMRISVDERGDAKGTVTIQLRGSSAQTLLDAFEDRVGSDRRDMLRAVVLGWIPWANVDEVRMLSQEGTWQLGLRASVTIPGFAQPEGNTLVLGGVAPLHVVTPAPVSASIASTFAGQGGRENPLSIETAWHYHLHRRIELADGWKVAGAPDGLSVQEGPLQASRSLRSEGSLVDEDFHLSISTGTIQPSEFDGFAEQARRIDDGFLSSIRVVRVKDWRGP